MRAQAGRSVAGVLAVSLWLVPAPATAVEAGDAAPAVVARPLQGDGPDVPLASLRGKVVYVDFWASWCAPCRQSMPALEAEFRRYAAQGFTVLGVNKDASTEDARRFLARVAVTFPLVADPGDALAKAFDVKAMPSGYLIDRAGRVRFIHRGFTERSRAELETQVRSLVEEAP